MNDERATGAMSAMEYEAVNTAMYAYWTERASAAEAQKARGVVDSGARGTATRGTHMNWIAQLLGKVAMNAGAPADAVFYQSPRDSPHDVETNGNKRVLPGWYRPTKDWDVVIDDPRGLPCVAIELKSQNGPSYSNNANNRAEEAAGNAIDLRRAVAEGVLVSDPWIGYVHVIEDDLISRRPGGQSDHKERGYDPIFQDWSYQGRVGLLARRLVEDRLYEAAWAIATSRGDCPGAKECATLKIQAQLDAAAERAEKAAAKKFEKAAAKIRDRTSRRGASMLEIEVPIAMPPAPRETLTHRHKFDWVELDAQRSGFVNFTSSMAAHIRACYS